MCSLGLVAEGRQQVEHPLQFVDRLLVQPLAARQPLAACGFSCGLERLAEHATVTAEVVPVDVLVVPAGTGAQEAAVREAVRLQADGATVEVEVRGRSPQAARRYAQRAGISRVVVVAPSGEVAPDHAMQPSVEERGANG